MAIALAQTVAQAASNATAPTTITPTLGTPSTAGNLLVLIVACTGSAVTPSITLPANWQSAQNTHITGAACAVFFYPENPGGITSVAVTLATTTGGGACATLIEYTGVGQLQTQDYGGNQSGNGNNPLSFTFPSVARVGELSIYAIGSGSAVASITGTPEWTQAGSAQTSTNAATINASLSVWWAQNIGTGTPQITGGSLTASVNWIDSAARFFTAAGGSITFDNVSGNGGVLVGQFFQGMIGG